MSVNELLVVVVYVMIALGDSAIMKEPPSRA